jgi:hypothetical protein
MRVDDPARRHRFVTIGRYTGGTSRFAAHRRIPVRWRCASN